MKTSLLVITVLLTSVLSAQVASQDGNGYPNPKTGGLYFMHDPCTIMVDSPEGQHQVAKRLAAERFEEFKSPKPTTYSVFASCHSSSFTGRNLAVEKIVAVLEAKPIFPLELDLSPKVQQNALGAKRTIQDATARFPTSVFEPDGRTLTIALVTSGGRVEFELLPADLLALRTPR